MKVDLKGYNLDKKLKKFPKVMDDAMDKAARHIEAEAKKRSPVVSTRYQSSWFVIRSRGGKGPAGVRAIVAPNVAYQGWVEDGSDSGSAPESHKGSNFKGHKVAKRTRDEEERTVREIFIREIRRKLT